MPKNNRNKSATIERVLKSTRTCLLGALLISAVTTSALAQNVTNRWTINQSGGITWNTKDNDAHRDHIEMSGKFVSSVIRYGVNADQSFWMSREIVWPMLRTIPNNTHASLTRQLNIDPVALININKQAVTSNKVSTIELDGTIKVTSLLNETLKLERTLFPSTDRPMFCEKFTLTNTGSTPVVVELPQISITSSTNPSEGTEGSYRITTQSQHHGVVTLAPSAATDYYLYITAQKSQEAAVEVNINEELSKRNQLLAFFSHNLVLDTPDEVLNRAFAFAKIRAAESIYQTKGGPMHGPGGLSYYAAIWANDQAEYVNPFFPYLGYDYGVESALNAYRHFARFMNPEYKPIPSSIIAEGIDIWNGAGDRGDAAMIAYGASRFALAQGSKVIANELWPLIEWCLEYNKRKLNDKGVVSSNSDELEGRFPSGDANLCTSSLYYDALVSAAYLGQSLGKDKGLLAAYQEQASTLRKNMEKHFGANVMGYDTYRYYDGNTKLRAWICIPLTVGIYERKAGTIDALFSPELWTADGLASQSGDKTFWDRSTLYALRGVFASGDIQRGLKFLQYYSNRRLLGEHVPYPVEAYPEGNQRHLSAESGLYCRIYTEGLFGMRPTGLNQLTITPQLPEGWSYMTMKNVHGHGKMFDVEVQRAGKKIHLIVSSNGKTIVSKRIANGETCQVKL